MNCGKCAWAIWDKYCGVVGCQSCDEPCPTREDFECAERGGYLAQHGCSKWKGETKMKTYVFVDFNDNYDPVSYVVHSDLTDSQRFEEYVRWAHHLGGEMVNEVMGRDASECVCDIDYLRLLLDAHGYKFEVCEDFEIIDW